MKPSRKQIEDAIDELRLAMLESIGVEEAEEVIQKAKVKAQKRLLMAREEIRALRIN